jgi:hypothetical protein
MYHPYFRGKQYDLITIRELAADLARAKFTPIIEPVRESLSGLQRTLESVVAAEGEAIVIVNPHHGELSGMGEIVTGVLRGGFEGTGISAGILLQPDLTSIQAMEIFEAHSNQSPVFIHAGFSQAKNLAEALAPARQDQRHIFVERHCGKLYQRHFQGTTRVLVRDGFNRCKRNSDYPDVEAFSDLHATFRDEGMDGFGDFLVVGDEFSDGGGPAYAVAIHLTFIDPDKDNAMQIYHFKSDTKDTPTDPAGKFAEALTTMMATVDSPNSKILGTRAVAEFRRLFEEGHFPGLGYVKRLSMSHHIETLAAYFQEN